MLKIIPKNTKRLVIYGGGKNLILKGNQVESTGKGNPTKSDTNGREVTEKGGG